MRVVHIFAKPILERNVTCNFIIQSLIDMLRNKRIPVTHEACVNTERSVVGAPVRAVSQEVLCGVLRDVDRLSNALASRSIVDDAFFEIESLRRHCSDVLEAKDTKDEAEGEARASPLAAMFLNLSVEAREC
nr:hypothetical protein BaRGS_030595 [Batillaria attramentaria]